MKSMFSVKAIPILAAAVLAPLVSLAQTGGEQKTLTGVVSDAMCGSHREGNVERRNPDGGVRASGEVTQITTGSIRRRLCPAILRFLLSR